MAHEIEWTDSAIASLIDAVEYTATVSPSYAATLAVRAERAAASLEQFPGRGHRVIQFEDPAVRELHVGNYRLIYRVRPTRVVILAFVHMSRDLSGLLDDKPE